jgi:hypothetical protein
MDIPVATTPHASAGGTEFSTGKFAQRKKIDNLYSKIHFITQISIPLGTFPPSPPLVRSRPAQNEMIRPHELPFWKYMTQGYIILKHPSKEAMRESSSSQNPHQ